MTSARFGALSGLLGVVIIIFGTEVAASAYRGRAGETYSPLNHFVSELGHAHVSAEAMLFNVSLVAGNACLVPFTLSRATWAGRQVGSSARSEWSLTFPVPWSEFVP